MSTPRHSRYAVIGHPLHTAVPRIHALFAAATGQALTYERLPTRWTGSVDRARVPRRRPRLVRHRAVQAGAWNWRRPPASARTRRAPPAPHWSGAAARGSPDDGAGLLNDFARHAVGIDDRGHDDAGAGAGGAARGIWSADRAKGRAGW
jgi:shikimate dehydrogenase